MDVDGQLSSSREEYDKKINLTVKLLRKREEAISKTWGYNLYKSIVDFPSDMLSSLRNNILPPNLTLRSAQAFREEPASQVQRIDARISAIEQEMEALKKEKDALWKESKPYRTKLRGCDAVLSPIRRLPFDIICEIASHTLPTHPFPCMNEAPLNISQTSSAWRAAAQSLPQLWSTIYVRVNVEKSWRKSCSQIAGFFIHAKKQPLSLFLFFDGTRTGPLGSRAKKMLAKFLKDIGPSMHRVERLGIGAYDLASIWNHLDLGGSSWNLESLKYLSTLSQDVLTTEEEGGTILPADVFLKTPALTHMSAYGGFFTSAAMGLHLIDSSSLMDLRLGEDISVGAWADLVHLCPRLERGEFRIQTWEDSEPRPTRTHEALQDLKLHIIYENSTATAILSQFQMPKIRVLRMSSEEEDDHSPPPASTFPSYVNLRYLQMDVNCDQDAPYIQGILRETVNLEELVITDCPLSFTTVFNAMALNSSIPNVTSPNTAVSNILPHLSAIRVQTESQLWRRDKSKLASETCLYFDTFAQMLNSRRPSQVPAGWQALQKALFLPHRITVCLPPNSLKEDFLEKTSLAQSEGLILRYVDPWSDELLDWEREPPLHPFDRWLAPEIDEGSSSLVPLSSEL